MKTFYAASCCFKLLQKNKFILLLAPLLLLLIILGYLSQYRVDDWHSADLIDIPFLMLPKSSCQTRPPFLVLLVTSAQDQLEARSAIRQTWGRVRTAHGQRVVTYFLLGYSREHQEQLQKESSLHKDIIQKDFTDTYYNLTLKVLMGLEWVNRFCPSVSFVMKTDSDMFVNVDYLTELLLQMNHKDIFTGFIMRNFGPVRNIFSKWFISRQEYPQEKYPPFCSGTGYVMSADVANRVWNISRIVPHFKLEDVYIGLCLAELKIDPVQIHSEEKFHNWKVTFSVCEFRKLITVHQVNPSELLSYWESLEDAADEHCPEMGEGGRLSGGGFTLTPSNTLPLIPVLFNIIATL
ncbi:beta-1,3-galactosyltransferase 5-like [Scyliorhinus canicula]|uniref:beta-1,3-galactosyltransferase 5-like n=1 Tax=Scyliorhinus canicula TaxID=7830 RepID=UPI0018F28A0B|nr:beta-1,3-galactosyltransferase 5-like [Scyliorhinus canicula]XP_038656899.1 beta-1,3-galactosyltransferase 5-like [Scyliorhinus canicula]